MDNNQLTCEPDRIELFLPTPAVLRAEQEKPLIYLGGAYGCRAALCVEGQPARGEQAQLIELEDLQNHRTGPLPIHRTGPLQPLNVLQPYGLVRRVPDSGIRRAWLELLPSNRWALFDGIHFSEGLLPPSKTANWRGLQVEADGVLNCFDVATGEIRWRLPLSGRSSNIVSCDVDGDGQVECLLGTRDGKLIAISDGGQRGIILWEKQFDGAVGSPILADITGDGKSEIIVSVGDGFVYILGAD